MMTIVPNFRALPFGQNSFIQLIKKKNFNRPQKIQKWPESFENLSLSRKA